MTARVSSTAEGPFVQQAGWLAGCIEPPLGRDRHFSSSLHGPVSRADNHIVQVQRRNRRLPSRSSDHALPRPCATQTPCLGRRCSPRSPPHERFQTFADHHHSARKVSVVSA
ncbi:hypothetical protein JDV02_004088 [Purpureocillium takamizusanense]|uniref:Uncharacterized protein n=1 Tax=Purpureocillium takamizusanense TaxID=2060973 RepID=A0A9Q8QD11_9HYPO|nr:uncharacterized protein JDV02_004088 [Purpureocillium takamizusanense]UNI17768.1 hypothetical protein JDV02_004088 [Purpureocillium takamizusanense]